MCGAVFQATAVEPLVEGLQRQRTLNPSGPLRDDYPFRTTGRGGAPRKLERTPAFSDRSGYNQNSGNPGENTHPIGCGEHDRIVCKGSPPREEPHAGDPIKKNRAQ